MTITPDLPRVDPNYANARRRTVTREATALSLVMYLSAGLLVLLIGTLLLAWANYKLAWEMNHRQIPVVRIDGTGRAALIEGAAMTYLPQEGEVRHFLAEFVQDYFGRHRTTVRERWTESLQFFEQRKAQTLMAQEQRDRWIEAFLTNDDPEIDIEIRAVILQNLKQPPYSVIVEFDKVYEGADGTVTNRETWYARIQFEAHPQRNLVNPLGFTITDLGVDPTLLPNGAKN